MAKFLFVFLFMVSGANAIPKEESVELEQLPEIIRAFIADKKACAFSVYYEPDGNFPDYMYLQLSCDGIPRFGKRPRGERRVIPAQTLAPQSSILDIITTFMSVGVEKGFKVNCSDNNCHMTKSK